MKLINSDDLNTLGGKLNLPLKYSFWPKIEDTAIVMGKDTFRGRLMRHTRLEQSSPVVGTPKDDECKLI
jgi:hypothetical protein